MDLAILRLKKNEERRIQTGHVWIYSNEIDIKATPLKNFSAGQEVRVEAYDKTPLGIAYVNPHSLISARMISRNVKERFDQQWFVSKFNTALQWREKFYVKPYYRLVFAEGDGLPGLVIDRFGDHVVAQLNTAGMDLKKDAIIAALQTVMPEVQSILFRNDSSIRLQEGLTTYVEAGFGTPPERVMLEENGTQFSAPLWDGQKTGWFYDHRLNRSRLKDYVQGKRVLDVFSYLGGFGIEAATFGAKEVVCLDASAAAVNAIKSNAQLNNVETKVTALCDDVFDGFKKLLAAGEKFDVIILDPPAFVKKLKDKKQGLIAYQRVNEAAFKCLSANGILVSCSCSMQIDYNDLLQAIRRASFKAGREIQIVERGHQAPDHPVHAAIPETDYLKMIIARCID
jgi:23S rRNA (cytosine1962-C5)-methyltransferase